MKKHILSILILATGVSANAWQVDTSADPDWLRNIEIKESVYNEMAKFKEFKNDPVTQTYIKNFVPQLHAKMMTEAGSFLHQVADSAGCKNVVQVSFPEYITTQINFDAKKKFESHFLKVESNACLGKKNIDQVFETMMSEKFQETVIPGFDWIKQDRSTNRACVGTSMFPIGDSSYCVTKKVLKAHNRYIIQSFNDHNDEGVDAPIYFKETINVITQDKSGDVSLYSLTYARSSNFSMKGIIRSKTEDVQEKVREKLIEFAK